jgi:probable rRNA maturation factor
MIDLDNQTDLCFNLSALEEIATSLTARDIELIIINDKSMKSLNIEHRGEESTTDVLSFPIDASLIENTNIPLGSIVISSSYVTQKAKDLGHTIQDEISLLFIHGLLHLLGFDHERDSGEMRQREEELIEEFNLPRSLIIRIGE